MPDEELRLQVYLARAGIASRRASEELIRAGRVRVNGQVAELGSKVNPRRQAVEVDGRPVFLQPREWIVLHKPKGYVSTREDPGGRKTVYDLLPPELHHLFHVGRLDRDSSGLLLFTNDGDAANRLLHPSFGTTKEYLADVEEPLDNRALRQLVRGVELEDGVAHAVSAEMAGTSESGLYRVRLVMREGRRREVRRMLEALGHPVRRLFRRSFGPIQLGRLGPGKWRELTEEELQLLQGSPPAAPAPQRPDRPGRPRRPRKR